MSLNNSAVSEVRQRLSEGNQGFVTRDELSRAIQPLSDSTERFAKELSEQKAAAFLSATNAGSDPKRRWSICKMVWGSANGFGRRAHVDDSFEKELFDDLHTKALSAGSDAAGGFLVPEEFRTDLIEQLAQRVAVRQAVAADGSTPIPMTSDTLRIARGSGSITASYVPENIDAALQDAGTDQVVLNLKDLIIAMQASNKLIELSNPEADTFIENRLMRAIIEREETAFLRDDGSPAEEPTGILNLADSGNKFNSTGAGGEIVIDDLLKAERLLLEAGLNPPFGWIANVKTFAKLRALKDGDGRPIFDPNWSAEAFGRLTPLGYPIFVSTQIPSNLGASSDRTEIYLVKGSEILIGQSTAGPVVSASKEFKFLADALVIKAVQRHDIALGHAKAVAVIENVLAV